MLDEMRILTVRQPWAWAIIHGCKDVENRARNLAGDYRGPVAIHAAAVYDRSADEHPEIRRMAEARGASSMREYLIPYGQRAYRHIAGVVDLVDVHRAGAHYNPIGAGVSQIDLSKQSCCSPWGERGAHHLVLANPRPLPKPIPYRGALGLRRLDEETITKITAALAAGEGTNR